MGYIYIHTNKINGKKYIGQTTRWPEYRWSKGNGYKGQPIYSAIKKYGWDNFDHEVIELPEDQLDYAERYLITWYDTMNSKKGYNCESGGSLNKRMSKESRRKISEGNKGKKKPHSEEAKRKMSEAHKGKKLSEESIRKRTETRRILNSGVGYHRTEETRKKLSEAKKGKHLSDETKRKMSEAKKGKGMGKRLYNNGTETHWFIPGTEPEGYILGSIKGGSLEQVREYCNR